MKEVVEGQAAFAIVAPVRRQQRSPRCMRIPCCLRVPLGKAGGISVRYDDWGVRSQQWTGLRSVSTSVCGVPVHYVRAEPASAAAPDAPVHLLVPPMTGSASMWIDLVPHLRQLGPVISVDLPGTITGHTGAP